MYKAKINILPPCHWFVLVFLCLVPTSNAKPGGDDEEDEDEQLDTPVSGDGLAYVCLDSFAVSCDEVSSEKRGAPSSSAFASIP